MKKDLNREQRLVYRGMERVMESDTDYNIVYESSYTRSDGIEIDVDKEYGGGLFDAETNSVVLSPTPSGGMVTTMDFRQVSIDQTTTINLFHEIGEINVGKADFRGGAVDYENHVRRILKMPLRPYDVYHQPQPVVPNPYANSKK